MPVAAQGPEAEERQSDRLIALQRCAARMRRIYGFGVAAKVLEYPFNDRRRLDAGDDAQPADALPARLDVNGENPLEALRQGQGPLPKLSYRMLVVALRTL